MPSELLTYCTVEFHRADDPPEDDRIVLLTDGQRVFTGKAIWNLDNTKVLFWLSEDETGLGSIIRAWAYLPDPNECMADCYPDRACRVCGCTQDHGCEGGCSWVEWDLCSKCPAGRA
jgi:hypothetical protein